MTTIITRLYATNEQAEEAVKTAAAKNSSINKNGSRNKKHQE